MRRILKFSQNSFDVKKNEKEFLSLKRGKYNEDRDLALNMTTSAMVKIDIISLNLIKRIVFELNYYI